MPVPMPATEFSTTSVHGACSRVSTPTCCRPVTSPSAHPTGMVTAATLTRRTRCRATFSSNWTRPAIQPTNSSNGIGMTRPAASALPAQVLTRHRAATR
ncbi:Uncharacterised protein [Mycobacteroides abscessus subsp. abscessus]|nr:Uncharacterised protein [Mycobacteroides abscessus subsp. abscessus]